MDLGKGLTSEEKDFVLKNPLPKEYSDSKRSKPKNDSNKDQNKNKNKGKNKGDSERHKNVRNL